MEKCSLWIVLSVTFVIISSAYGGEFCQGGSGFVYCSYGCCGYLDQDCCGPSVGLIVGLIVGGLLVVSIIIAVVCCCRRRRGVLGTVIRSNPGVTTVVQSGQTTMTAGQPGVFYPPQTYGAATCGPPLYTADGYPQSYQQPPKPYPQPPQPYLPPAQPYPPPAQPYPPPAQPYPPPAQPYPPPAQPYPPPVQSYPPSAPPYPMPMGQPPNPPPYEAVDQYPAYKQ